MSKLPRVALASLTPEVSIQAVILPPQVTTMEKMPRQVTIVATVLLWLLMPHFSLWAAEPVVLTPAMGRLPLGAHMDILEDKVKQWTIHDVVAEPVAALFARSLTDAPGFGFTLSAYWVRFAVVNPSDQDVHWCFEVDYPPLDSILLYAPTADGQFQLRRAGDLLPFHAREVPYKTFIFLLHTPAQSQQTYYVRVENAGVVNLPLSLYSPAALTEKITHEQIVLGIYHGAILIMLVYNFFIYLSIREPSYLYYVLCNSGWMLAMLTLNGLAFQYLWPRQVWWANNSLLFFFCFSFLWGVQFTRSFLDTAWHTPRFDMLLRGLMALGGLGVVCALSTPYALGVRLTNIIGMTSLLVWLNGFLCFRLKVRAARYYIIGWSLSILGVAVLSLKNYGVLPHNTFTVWAPQLGSAAEIILLSFGLADRIRMLHRDKEQAEKTLIETQLTMQATLLKEVHHRVKNNLQVIASLLNLQSNHVQDPQVLTMFKESRHRVESMALIHERLYHSSDATRLDFTEYIRTLLMHLFAAYNTGAAAITLKLNADNVTLGVDTAIPCGLILHELVANALKHAFPAGTSGELGIDLHANEHAQFTLRVSDNGVGFPKDIDFHQTESLGLQLVHALTEQLEGTIELQRNGGTTFTLTFTALTYKQRG